MVRRATARCIAALILALGALVAAWYAVSAVVVALVTWPGLVLLGACVALLAWQATPTRQETHP